MKAFSAIPKLVIKSWANELKTLGKSYPLLAGFVLLLLVSIPVLEIYAISPIKNFFISSLSQQPVFRALFLWWLIPATVFIATLALNCFVLISPTRSKIDMFLKPLPILAMDQRLGFLLPLVGVSLIIGMLFAAPIISAYCLAFAGWVQALALNLLLVLLLTSFCLLSLLLLHAVNFVLGRLLGLSEYLAVQLSTYITIVMFSICYLAWTVNALAVLTKGSKGIVISQIFLLPLFSGIADFQWPQMILVGLCLLISILVLVALNYRIMSVMSFAQNYNPVLLLGRVLFPRKAPAALAVYEMKIYVRDFEALIGNVLFPLVCVIILVFVRHNLGSASKVVISIIPTLIWLQVFALAYMSFGRSQASKCIKVLPVKHHVVLFTSYFVNLVVSLLMGALSFVPYAILFPELLNVYLQTILISIVFISAGYFIGIVLPYSNEYPFEMIYRGFALMLLGLPISFAVTQVVMSTGSPKNIPLLMAGVMLMLLIGIYYMGDWRMKNDMA